MLMVAVACFAVAAILSVKIAIDTWPKWKAYKKAVLASAAFLFAEAMGLTAYIAGPAPQPSAAVQAKAEPKDSCAPGGRLEKSALCKPIMSDGAWRDFEAAAERSHANYEAQRRYNDALHDYVESYHRLPPEHVVIDR